MPLIRAVLGAALVASCTPANQLQGSLGELTSLAFTDVLVTQSAGTGTSPPSFVVSYRDADDAGGYATPFKLAVDLTGLPPLTKDQAPIDLGSLEPDAGTPVAVASRSVPGDMRLFPAISHGSLWIDQDIQVGQQGSGHFFLVFGFQMDDSIAQGRTVEGRFQAVVGQ
jgi:hypothetical protein